MKRYELIEHTADMGLAAYGKDLAGAFANAAYGMFSIIAELEEVKEGESRRIEINEECGEGHLKADCCGEKYDASRHHLKTGIKSATYHMLEVDRAKNRVQVIFDV